MTAPGIFALKATSRAVDGTSRFEKEMPRGGVLIGVEVVRESFEISGATPPGGNGLSRAQVVTSSHDDRHFLKR